MHNCHKLHLDSNRNTKNIKIIKIAIENANLWGEICDMRILLKYAENAATCEMYENHKFALNSDMPNYFSHFLLDHFLTRLNIALSVFVTA